MSSVRWEKLRALGCFEELDRRLRAGTPPPEVADYIQQECKEYLQASRTSLTTILYEYRRELGALGLAENAMPEYVRTAKERIGTGMSELDEYELLYRQQSDRIESMIRLEQKMGFQNPKIDNAMRVASELLQARHRVKMDLSPPGQGRNLGSLTVRPEVADEIAYRYGEQAREAVINPESRAKVLSMYAMLRARAEMERQKQDRARIELVQEEAPEKKQA